MMHKITRGPGPVLVALTAVVALAACGGAPTAATEITLLGYQTGGFREQYTRAVIEPFEQSHPGVRVTYYGVRNSATELAVLRGHKGQDSPPPADVTIIDLSVATIAKDEGLLDEIRLDRVPNAKTLHAIGAELGAFGLPVTYDTLALVYDTRAVTPAPTSWTALWNPAHKGRVVVPAEGGGDIQAISLTIVANRLAGNDDFARDLTPGIERLTALAPLVQTWEPKPDAYTLVANGTAALAIGWNARSQFHVNESQGRLGSVLPVEGTVSQVNVIAAVKGTRQRELVEAFIDYALGAEAQARFSAAMFYAPTNGTVQLDAATRQRIPLLDEANRARLIPVDWLQVGAMRERILEPWRRTIIPASR
jgi:putative spermidine/putrescine transport system substrate-binding protein